MKKELLKRLNKEMEIKNESWKKIEEANRQIEMLQNQIKQETYKMEVQNKIINKINEDLKKCL